MTAPIRLTVVLTHPVQYFAPWFRHITTACPEIDLTVLYGALPDAEQQGTGFGEAFTWDGPITDGYRFEVCTAAAGKRFDSDSFVGIDVPDIGRRIAATRPDVVLVPGWHSIMQVRALRACRRLGIPVLYRGDSNLFSGPRRLVGPMWALKTRLMLRQFDACLSVGTAADEYLRRFGVPDPLIFRSPHCVDNAQWGAVADGLRASDGRARARHAVGARDDDFVVLFAGKFQSRKRPVDAVRAVARLGGGSMLVMAGNGPLAGECRAEAERLGVRLAWRGFLNQSELPEAFAAADCLVVPSAWESWGLIVNEALASGVPCVATTGVASVRDLIVDGVTGYSTLPGDVDALAARLDELRQASARGHDFSSACRDQAARCSFGVATSGLLAACRRVLARRRCAADQRGAMPRVVACCGNMVIVSGVERMTFEVLRVLREHGAAVHCIVNRWESARIVSLADEIGASWSTGYYWYSLKRRGWTFAEAAQAGWDVCCTSGSLLRDVWRLRATHVLVPDFAAVLRNLPALLVLRLCRVPVIARLGNAPEAGAFYRRLWRWVISPAVDEFVANSRFTAAELAATGVDARKTRVVYNAAPSRPERPTPSSTRNERASALAIASKDEYRIIYVGQMIPPKGVDLLMDAVGLLAVRGYPVTLDAVGDIDGWEPPAWEGFRSRLRERAEQPDLRGRVRFLGVREDVPALLAGAAIHCCPSRPEIREGFGVVNVEAKGAGIPSVVTPTGALPELIDHGRNGWICSDATVDSLVEGLEYFLSNPARLEEAGREARRSERQFSRERFAAAWLNIFGIDRRQLSVEESCSFTRC